MEQLCSVETAKTPKRQDSMKQLPSCLKQFKRLVAIHPHVLPKDHTLITPKSLTVFSKAHSMAHLFVSPTNAAYRVSGSNSTYIVDVTHACRSTNTARPRYTSAGHIDAIGRFVLDVPACYHENVTQTLYTYHTTERAYSTLAAELQRANLLASRTLAFV